MYRTLFATKQCIPFVIWYNTCIDIVTSETVKFLSNYVTRYKEERCKNKRTKYSNNSVICSVSLKPNLYLETL